MSDCKSPWYSLRDPHDWGKWEDKKRGVYKFAGNVQGVIIVQERRCQRCGAVELREECS